MHDRTPGAAALVKRFLHAFLVTRSAQAAAECLSAHVVWSRLSEGGDIHGRTAALNALDAEIAAAPHPFTLHTLSEQEERLTEYQSMATVKVAARHTTATHHYLVTAVTRVESGTERIVSLHISEDEAQRLTAQLARLTEQLRLYRISQNAGTFRISVEGSFPLLYGNDRLYQMLGYESKPLREKLRRGCIEYVHPDDRKMVLENIQQALRGGEKYTQWIMRIFTGAGELRYMQVVGSFTQTAEGNVMEGIELDVTEQKLVEQQLFERNAIFDLLLENSALSMWMYDRTTHMATLISSKKHARPISPSGLANYPESVIATGFIQRDSIEDLRELMKKVDAGAATSSAEIWCSPKYSDPWCDRVTYINVFDATGNIIRTVGIAEDITEQKLAQQQYEEELSYHESLQTENMLVKVRCNLTKNIVESYIANDAVGISCDGMPYDVGVEALAVTGYAQEEQDLIRRMLDTERVLKAVEQGNHFYSLDYRRKTHDGKVIWVNSSVKTYKDMRSGDIKSFMYTFDINREKINNAITKTVVNTDYDFIMFVDIINNSFFLFRRNDDLVLVPPEYGDDYITMMQTVNRTAVLPSDVDRAIKDMMPQSIAENLEIVPVFSSVYPVIESDRGVGYKKITYTWLSKELGQIVLTRSDVSAVVQEQHRQQELLKNALKQAEQASNAKTDFLSKMSHEIRTPMNAIIGMNALAAQNLHNPQQAADCISKVGLSARFLLSLINDILDMSRIESGKLNLRQESIPFSEFINGINSIIYEQATECGITYDAIITGFIAESYIGDSMKLQQILVNLLGNAVKFTPKGGKVQLIISQEHTECDTAMMKFTINDTGIGISEEFQRIMFDPFEQEQNGITTPYNGTGLGLAITKNLVQLMGGRITVNSIVGVGTEFVISLPLGIDTEARPCKIKAEMPLSTLSALVVDDEILICQQTHELLMDLGMKAEWVDSGHKAVDLVRTRWENRKRFDIILIDWKMPDMDGMETARQIRKIVGPDITIIIITAYEWAEIERDAKAAGVNMLMSKPLFRSSLISAFEKIYTDRKKEKICAAQTVEYDFTGGRVLLTEDHLLNVEVARRLLQVKGMEVEVAENGLMAIEAFTSHPDHYYDLILMDIRMPVMDGLTAVKSIRQLKKATAKSIPIIAMSANAFDDDLEKSREAGMNAHLSKPIEPQHLYETIRRFTQKKEEKSEN